MPKTSMVLLNKPCCLLVSLIVTAVLFTAGGAPALGQDDSVKTSVIGKEPTVDTEVSVAPPGASDAVTQPEATQPILPHPSSSAKKWRERYEKLVAGLNDGSLNEKDADTLYQDVKRNLEILRNRLRGFLKPLIAREPSEKKAALPGETTNKAHQEKVPGTDLPKGSGTDNVQAAGQLSADLAALYKLRTELLPHLSPSLRDAVTGTGIEGVQAFKEEIDYLLLMLRARLHLMPQLGNRSLDRLTSAPVPAILVSLQFIFACFVFYWWRRWAKKGIPDLRTSILGLKPRKWVHSWSAKLLWYINRVRSPVEWAFFFYMLISIVKTSRGQVVFDLFWTNARLILIAWFVVSLLDALSTRGAAGLRSDTAKLRMRSFWLMAIWALVVSLGLGITEDLVDTGTVYAWVWIFSKLLVLPLLLLLVQWWRPEIYRILEEIPQPPVFITKIINMQRGLVGFFGAGLGAVYLILKSLRQKMLKLVVKFEGGRYLVANLTRIEAMRVSEREPQRIEGEPLADELRAKLFDDNGGTVESVVGNTLDEMARLVEKEKLGEAAIVVEHGGGKSFLLKQLANRYGNRMLTFDCPPGNANAYIRAFADALGLGTPDPDATVISGILQDRNIKIIAVDNIHRLTRPALGGQRYLDEALEMLRPIEAPVFWFYTLDWSAWQYISRVRDNTLFLNEIIRLPLWSEAQIKELIELRSAYVGIKPDFSNLVLPRQFEDEELDTEEERNRCGYFRILWNASDGNPVASLHMWADSLRVASSGTVKVALPQLPEAGELDNVGMTVLLTLRVIAQSGMATEEQIIDSLRLPANEVASAVTLARNREWIESIEGFYRLSWRWFRSIMRVLARQNLLVRK